MNQPKNIEWNQNRGKILGKIKLDLTAQLQTPSSTKTPPVIEVFLALNHFKIFGI